MQFASLILLAGALWAGLPANAQSRTGVFDLVLSGGRVVDPESGLDGVRNVGITAGRIAALSEEPLRGRRVIDVRGLVVAPGFIDLHSHGQDLKSNQLQAQDGVTSALETELGTTAVARWYAEREGASPINYGAAVGHRQARVLALSAVDVPDPLFSPDISKVEQRSEWRVNAATEEQVRESWPCSPKVWTKARWASERSFSTRLALDARRYCSCSSWQPGVRCQCSRTSAPWRCRAQQWSRGRTGSRRRRSRDRCAAPHHAHCE